MRNTPCKTPIPQRMKVVDGVLQAEYEGSVDKGTAGGQDAAVSHGGRVVTEQVLGNPIGNFSRIGDT